MDQIKSRWPLIRQGSGIFASGPARLSMLYKMKCRDITNLPSKARGLQTMKSGVAASREGGYER